MAKEEEIQIAVNIFIEIIYEMYIRDLKNGKINNSVSGSGPVHLLNKYMK